MAVNWLEIGILMALFVALLASIGVYVRLKLIPNVLSKAEVWMGGAIGRFMANLARQADEEGLGGEGGEGAGSLKFMGFTINDETIRTFGKIIELAQQFGFLKGSGGGGENPFLRP